MSVQIKVLKPATIPLRLRNFLFTKSLFHIRTRLQATFNATRSWGTACQAFARPCGRSWVLRWSFRWSCTRILKLTTVT
jgi:hypothetical protein